MVGPVDTKISTYIFLLGIAWYYFALRIVHLLHLFSMTLSSPTPADEFSPAIDVENFFKALGSGAPNKIPDESAGGDDADFEKQIDVRPSCHAWRK